MNKTYFYKFAWKYKTTHVMKQPSNVKEYLPAVTIKQNMYQFYHNLLVKNISVNF